MVKWTAVLVPDCSTNMHRWIKADDGQTCAICGVKVVVTRGGV